MILRWCLMAEAEPIKKKQSDLYPIYFDPNKTPECLDYHRTVIAQYSNSPRLLSLIGCFSDAMKVCSFFNDFYNHIWNIDTATGLGLDIWGQIVGVNRTIKTFTGFFWGFNEETLLLARPYHDMNGFNDTITDPMDRRTAIGMFRDYQELEGEVTFQDNNFRRLILTKAHANISNYTINDLNFILMFIFGDKDKGHEIYIRDNFDMTMTLVFNWMPNTDEVAIILNTGLLIKPAGVMLNVSVELP